MSKHSKNNWETVRVFVSVSKPGRRFTPAVRISMLRGRHTRFSHTPGVIDETDGVEGSYEERFQPRMHMQDDQITEYIELLQTSASAVGYAEKKATKVSKNEVTTPLVEVMFKRSQ